MSQFVDTTTSTRMDPLVEQEVKRVEAMVARARAKGRDTIAYVFTHKAAEDVLEAKGYHLDHFDMFEVDITWGDVDFEPEEPAEAEAEKQQQSN
jgi:hypothetical protein